MVPEGAGTSKGSATRRGLGPGPAESPADLSCLSTALPTPYLLVYDAESAACRHLVDWIQLRDRTGLVVSFPFQNGELVRVAPELAGRPLQFEIHAVDTGNRCVWAGAEVLPQLMRRLPRWRIVAPLLSLPGVSSLVGRIYRRFAAGRYRLSGRTPLR